MFLCQRCGGDLERTAEIYAGDTVWLCLKCGAPWIWTLAGWGLVKGLGILRRVESVHG